MIVSASRRTDIPSFYSDWFMARLAAGYTYMQNPFNKKKLYHIPLDPALVDCIVFWTKNPGPMLKKLDRMTELGYTYIFQFTLTPYGNEIEMNLPDKNYLLSLFRELSAKIGKERLLWRYDPILFTPELDLSYHAEKFHEYCGALSGFTKYCTVSFLDIYRKNKKWVAQKGIKIPDEHQKALLIKEMCSIGRAHGIQIRVCCEVEDFTHLGALPGACIDLEVIQKATGYPLRIPKDKNQRQGCNCAASVDIGAYDTCGNGCLYCYAGGKGEQKNDLRSSPVLGGAANLMNAEIVYRQYQSWRSLI